MAARLPLNRATASLTYHGGLASHLDVALPILDKRGLRATFYPPPATFFERVQDWKRAGETHEVGNASFHGVTLGGDLPNWTLEMVEGDLAESEKLLTELFPHQGPHTFAYPGSSSQCLRSLDERVEVSYAPLIDNKFVAAVSMDAGLNAPGPVDLHRLRTVKVLDADDALQRATEAIEQGAWIVFWIGELTLEAKLAHIRLCDWLAEKKELISTEPVIDVATRLLSVPGSKR